MVVEMFVSVFGSPGLLDVELGCECWVVESKLSGGADIRERWVVVPDQGLTAAQI